jgi:hypothetical protein
MTPIAASPPNAPSRFVRLPNLGPANERRGEVGGGSFGPASPHRSLHNAEMSGRRAGSASSVREMRRSRLALTSGRRFANGSGLERPNAPLVAGGVPASIS